MSLVWTIIASFLYIEIGIVLLFVLPVASATRWQRFFRSRFLAMLTGQAQMYFYLLLGILVLFLLEAIREMRKYSNIEEAVVVNANAEMHHSMRLFRAQRNFYIAGFAIFLTLVIRRLVLLISLQATLLAQSQASMRQAESASAAARTAMNAAAQPSAPDGDDADTSTAEENKLQVNALKEIVDDLQAKLVHERKDKEALKSQSESLSREYDRLTAEFSKLQNVTTTTTAAKPKKDH